ncbi:MAG: dimethyl sulfoxide reductase anchor subunit [Anaerolineales bacterium]|nr:dimethyl sulfoxide reductase anchor subunit [Anaerolineales bacterium]
MDVREWALIAFTILMQLSVGAFVVLGAVHYFAAQSKGQAEADRLSDRALLAIGPILVLALLASLFHLGNPLNAYRAVANLGNSWLSREILLSVLFTAVGGVFALMQWRKLGTFTVRTVVAGLAALIGLVQVYSMAMIYQLDLQPAWNTVFTPISFYTTMLLLGVLALGAAFVANYTYLQRQGAATGPQSELLRGALRWFAVAAVVLLGIEFVVAPVQVAYLAASPIPEAAASVAVLFTQYSLVFALRLVLVFIGAGVFGFFLYRNAISPGRERILGTLAYTAFGLVLVSEVLGRFLFYASHLKIGL